MWGGEAGHEVRNPYKLRQRWGDLPPEAFDLLRSLRLTYGITLAEQVAGMLKLVRDEARKSLAEERAALIDQVMLAGEQLDFPLIVTEAFDLAPTVFCWSAFCGNASIEQLRLAHDAAHLKLQVKRGRLKLSEAQDTWKNLSQRLCAWYNAREMDS